jgi:DNA-binding NtrC family response regulator
MTSDMPEGKPEARVLVVDDEAQIRRLVSVLLRRLVGEYTVGVWEAGTAEEAILALQGGAFDLVISDHSMPGKTGIDLLEIAHSRYPQTGRMLITALAQLDIGVEAINRGHVDAFLRKPWDNDAFVALVDSLLAPRVKARAMMASQPHAVAKASAPPPRSTSAVAAAPAPKSSAKAKLEADLADLERQLRQIRVRLGLGSISAEGYAALNADLSKKRAEIEVKLLELSL